MLIEEGLNLDKFYLCRVRFFAMKKLGIALIFLMSCGLQAQEERFRKGGGKDQPEEEQRDEKGKADSAKEKSSKLDKFVFGGNLGMSFGNVTQVLVSPRVGYRVADNLIAGGGYFYQYYSIDEIFRGGRREPVDFSTSTHGPLFFADWFPMDNVFTGLQFEYLNYDFIELPASGPPVEGNRWGSVMWVQAGYRQSTGSRGYVLLGARANILHDRRSPYPTWWMPVISFFF